MKHILSIALVVVCTSLFTAHRPASAADSSNEYPTRPIRVVVAQSPGSSIDTMCRVVFAKMSELLGEQLVIDNRVGAGGTIGAGIAAHAEPDGYTLFAAATASQVIGPQIYKKVTTYDPFRDFQPVALFAITQNVLVVNPSTPFTSVKDLVAYAKANPGKLKWANAGTGFQSHLAGVLFTHMAGITVLHVPYKGAGPSLNAVMSGESQVTFVPAPSVMGHVHAGRLRALAVGGEKRAEAAPELPTVIEAGIPGFVSSGWAGLEAQSKVPKRIIDKLRQTLHAAVADPATNAALKRTGAEPVTSGSGADFAALIKRDWKSFGDAIRVAGLKAN
jgi:tripartite-type tricarboxylate transporter receptor subunit TctC